MISWCVIQTQPNKEYVAKTNLLQQGFEVYLPQIKKIRKHARKVDEVLAPLFPRYVFVGLDLARDAWRSLNGTRGVSHVLTGESNKPSVVPSAIVESLQQQEEAGVLPVEGALALVAGDAVRVLSGAFDGQTGIVQNWTDQQRVQILLTFLGRETQVSLPLSVVERA